MVTAGVTGPKDFYGRQFQEVYATSDVEEVYESAEACEKEREQRVDRQRRAGKGWICVPYDRRRG